MLPDKDELAEKLLHRLADPDTCGVKGCENTTVVELVTLKRFDPIDHDAVPVALCEHHQEWADRRNEFAEEMHDKLREARKEIGQAHIEQVRELATPQDGQLREDIAMGEIDAPVRTVEDMHDAPAADGGERE